MTCPTCEMEGLRRVHDLKIHARHCPSGRGGWARVAALRREGEEAAAIRLARKLMGVKAPAMSEEAKERLRTFREEHKEEVRRRPVQRRANKARIKSVRPSPQLTLWKGA